MNMSVKQRAVVVVTALLLALGPSLDLTPLAPAPTAEAFYPELHIEIFEDAPGNTFSAEAQGWVADGLRKSDLLAGQAHPEWHFDSANSPAAICDLWNMVPPQGNGPNWLLDEAARLAVEAFRKAVATPPPGANQVPPRQEALTAYGQYLHAVQDFYAHTNWIELHEVQKKQAELAPIQASCNATELASLQPELQSGYFKLDITTLHSDAPDLCGPVSGQRPPANSGFRQCHGPPHPDRAQETLAALGDLERAYLEYQARQAGGRDLTKTTLDPKLMLAKDVPDYYHGKETLTLPNGTVTTYHAEAVRLASLATTESFTELKKRVVERLEKDLPDRDPECLFKALIEGGDSTCAKGVRLGTIYSRWVTIVDESEMPLWENPAGGIIDAETMSGMGDVKVTIQFDPAHPDDDGRIPITGGSLRFGTGSVDGYQHYFVATQARGSIGPVADGYYGYVEFTGTYSIYQGSTSMMATNDRVESFGLAVDAAGFPVLCQRLPAPAGDVVKQYQDCLARTAIKLGWGPPPPSP